MTVTRWPFGTDADRDDPLTALRVPAVESFSPQWRYIAAYVKPQSETGAHWGSTERPTDAEALQLASFIQEYLQNWFNAGYIQKLANRDLDVDSQANTTLFVKYGPDDWGYRLDSWTRGHLFVPPRPSYRERFPDEACGGLLSLVQVMDRRHTIADEPMQHWVEWKAAHPEVFPVEVAR